MRIGVECLVLAVTLHSTSAWAQTSSSESAAVEFGHLGLRQFEKADWDGAYRAFEQAENEAHSPVFVVYMARCKRNSGRLLDARQLYERVVSDPSRVGRPAQWDTAIEEAKMELQDLAGRIPSIKVSLNRQDAGDSEIWIDGKPNPGLRLENPIELDPGTHVVAVRTSKGYTAERAITVGEGDAEMPLELALSAGVPREEVAARRGPSPERKPLGKEERDFQSLAPPLPVLVVLGAAGVAIVVGSTTGILALTETNAIRRSCTGTTCDASEKSRAENAKTLATVSTVSFVAGGVAAVGGVCLWIVLREDRAPSRAGEVSAGVRVQF